MMARNTTGFIAILASPLLLLLVATALSLAAAQNVPPDWRAGVERGDILFTLDEPVDPERMTYVGNGYAATVVTTDTMYAVGVFNGFNSSSTRARIPSTMAIYVTNAESTGSALDLSNGVYYRRSQFQQCLACAVVDIEQRWYAHRTMPSLLVHELHINVTSRPKNTTEVVTLTLANNQGPASNDINFSTVTAPIGGVTVWQGEVKAAEEKDSKPQQVAVCFSQLPQSVSFNVNSTTRQKYYYITAIRTSLDSSDVVTDACKDWTSGQKLTRVPYPHDLFTQHVEEWSRVWDSGIEVGGRLELARAINSSLYYLLSSIRPVQTDAKFPIAAYSLSPGSLSTDGYNGHSFWDAETWMYPSLLLFHPQLASNVLDYRFQRIVPARSKATDYGYQGTMFPWESAFTGYEVCPWAPGSQREQHITGDIGLAVYQYWRVTKDLNWLKTVGFPLISDIAQFWSSRATLDTTTGLYGILGVVGPDEYATGKDGSGINNNAYTNAIAVDCLNFAIEAAQILGSTPPAQWKVVASKMYYPFDAALQYHPEYQGYVRGQIIKQADTIMLGYPIMLPMNATVRRNDLEYYQKVTDINGPAMTWGMFALGYIELEDYPTAAKYFNQSYQYNINLPFFAWMETPQGGCNHFLTGAGGFLQGVWAGYGGVRIEAEAISFTPHLPEGTTYVRYRQMNYLGSKVTVFYNDREISFTLDEAQSGAQSLVAVDPKGEKHRLVQNKAVSIPLSSSKPTTVQLTHA